MRLCLAQTHTLKQVPGPPSNEIYDIFTDSKGFLWIAHNAGISKYDGISFTNFSNPQQSSLGTTNILEDKLGRIWFINFTGQIFYIENGHMNLLSAYKSEAERFFPSIGLLNDQLLATTKLGLFVCDVNTLKCHYEHYTGQVGKGTTSLTLLKNKALIYGNGYWHIFQPGKPLRPAIINSSSNRPIAANSSTLCGVSYHDTAFIFSNPTNIFYKLLVKNDTVKVCAQMQLDAFINTISVINNKYWINTARASINAQSKNESLNGYNISCMAVDREGHYWYGSLQHGLLTDSAISGSREKGRIFSANNGDLIKCLESDGQCLLLGTQNGLLISYNTITGQSSVLTALPANDNGINYLKLLKDGSILIGSSVYTYILNVKTHTLQPVGPIRALKQADQIKGALLLASSNSMVILPDGDDAVTMERFRAKFSGLVDRSYDNFTTRFRILYYEKRSRAICYSPASQTIWVSFKDGLYKVNHSGITPFYYHRSPVYTSCLAAQGSEVIAGTFSNGILIIDGDHIRHLDANDGLLSNNIANLKVLGHNLWVFTSGAVQIFDLDSLRLIYKYPFPGGNSEPLADAVEINGNCYFVSLNGLYKLTPVQKEADSVRIYLNSFFINRKDTDVVDDLELKHSENDIQIALGTPYLFNAREIVIKYRLGADSTARWIYTRPGERIFHFASLAPGSYRFEARAIKRQTGLLSNPFIINFTIRPPWWQMWWFKLAIIAASLIVIVAAIRVYFLNKLRKQQSEYEKRLIVERERQHISREIHDNIGQALSVIKLNLDMSSPAEVNDTKELIGEVIQDLRQFTHGLYYGKLLTDKLFEVIKKDIERLNNSGQLVASLDIKVDKTPMGEQTELLIYRIFQESINNVLKHARAKNVLVKIRNSKKQFKLSISDDGKGFSAENHDKGLGLDSMYKRAELLKGQLSIESEIGEGTKVELVVYHSQI